VGFLEAQRRLSVFSRDETLGRFFLRPIATKSGFPYLQMAALPPERRGFMSSSANSEEAGALRSFIAIVLAVVVALVVLGFTAGLAGIGAFAILGTAAMLILLTVMTAGGD
jgi:hypothetical protein